MLLWQRYEAATDQVEDLDDDDAQGDLDWFCGILRGSHWCLVVIQEVPHQLLLGGQVGVGGPVERCKQYTEYTRGQLIEQFI